MESNSIMLTEKSRQRLVALYLQYQGARDAADAASRIAQQRQNDYLQQLAAVKEAIGIDPNADCDLNLDTGTLTLTGAEETASHKRPSETGP